MVVPMKKVSEISHFLRRGYCSDQNDTDKILQKNSERIQRLGKLCETGIVKWREFFLNLLKNECCFLRFGFKLIRSKQLDLRGFNTTKLKLTSPHMFFFLLFYICTFILAKDSNMTFSCVTFMSTWLLPCNDEK